jgi:LPXTG-motif cell wall-anchored protein
MRRAVLIVSTMAFAPLLALAPSVPAYAGGVPADIAITNSPSTFTVGQDGAFTVSLSNSEEPENTTFDYDVIDTVPASFDITSVDDGDYACTTDNTAHTVECTITADIDTSSTESFTIHTTPSTTVGSPFTDTASYTFEEATSPTPTPTETATKPPSVAHAAPGAGLALFGLTATDQVAVRAAASPSASPTPTSTPTPTPTPTHTPTHAPTPTPSPSVSATHVVSPPSTLPNTGGSDLAQLVAIGALMISAGGFLAAVTRRRRA